MTPNRQISAQPWRRVQRSVRVDDRLYDYELTCGHKARRARAAHRPIAKKLRCEDCPTKSSVFDRSDLDEI